MRSLWYLWTTKARFPKETDVDKKVEKREENNSGEAQTINQADSSNKHVDIEDRVDEVTNEADDHSPYASDKSSDMVETNENSEVDITAMKVSDRQKTSSDNQYIAVSDGSSVSTSDNQQVSASYNKYVEVDVDKKVDINEHNNCDKSDPINEAGSSDKHVDSGERVGEMTNEADKHESSPAAYEKSADIEANKNSDEGMPTVDVSDTQKNLSDNPRISVSDSTGDNQQTCVSDNACDSQHISVCDSQKELSEVGCSTNATDGVPSDKEQPQDWLISTNNIDTW